MQTRLLEIEIFPSNGPAPYKYERARFIFQTGRIGNIGSNSFQVFSIYSTLEEVRRFLSKENNRKKIIEIKKLFNRATIIFYKP